MRNGGDMADNGSRGGAWSRWMQETVLKGEPTGFAGGMLLTAESLRTWTAALGPEPSVSPGSLWDKRNLRPRARPAEYKVRFNSISRWRLCAAQGQLRGTIQWHHSGGRTDWETQQGPGTGGSRMGWKQPAPEKASRKAVSSEAARLDYRM